MCFVYSTWFQTLRVNFRIKLVQTVLKTHSIHQIAVKAVVKRLIQMVTVLSVFNSFSQNSGQKIKRMSTKVSSRFSNNFVTHWVFFSDLQSVDGFFRKFSWWKTSSNVQNTHFMTKVPSDLHALTCSQNSSFKGGWSMMSRSTVEVNTWQVDSQLFDFLHPFWDFFCTVQIVTKFAWKRCC